MIPVIGILGTAWMIWHIAEDNATRFGVYGLCLVMFGVLVIYAVPWLIYQKKPFFRPVPVERVKTVRTKSMQKCQVDTGDSKRRNEKSKSECLFYLSKIR